MGREGWMGGMDGEGWDRREGKGGMGREGYGMRREEWKE